MPWVLPRVIPPGGASVAGRQFAQGVEIGMSPYVFQRRKEAYGEDAEVFRPERWIEATTTNGEDKKILDKNLLTFGHGNRICVGKVSFVVWPFFCPPLDKKRSFCGADNHCRCRTLRSWSCRNWHLRSCIVTSSHLPLATSPTRRIDSQDAG